MCAQLTVYKKLILEQRESQTGAQLQKLRFFQPPSRATGAQFYDRQYRHRNFYFTVALRANVKPAHCKFKGRQYSSTMRLMQFYARQRFSATRDTTSLTHNHCPAALQRCQRLLNGTPCGYVRVRHRPAMCVSLSINASCCASVYTAFST